MLENLIKPILFAEVVIGFFIMEIAWEIWIRWIRK